MFGADVQKLFVRVTRRLGFIHPCRKSYVKVFLT
jgi:hypothetical protein